MSYIETEIYKILGRHLRAARESAGLTLSDVAEKISATPMTIQRYEKGDRKISVEKIRSLCTLYDVDADQLMQSSIDRSTSTSSFASDIAGLLQDKSYDVQNDALTLMERFVECDTYNRGKILAYAQGISEKAPTEEEAIVQKYDPSLHDVVRDQLKVRKEYVDSAKSSVPAKKSV